MTAGIPDERVDVADQAAALILSQFKRLQTFTGGRTYVCGELEELERICCAEVQQAESITHDLITMRLLSTAVGAQLNQWGRRLGCLRMGMGDDDYRAMLYCWILVLNSDGQAGTLQEIVRRLAGATSVSYNQSGRAHFVLSYDLATPTTAARRELIETALEMAACLGVSWTVTEGDSAGYFGFSENTDPACKGFDQGGLSALVAQVNQ
jgi:hypothetical protein